MGTQRLQFDSPQIAKEMEGEGRVCKRYYDFSQCWFWPVWLTSCEWDILRQLSSMPEYTGPEERKGEIYLRNFREFNTCWYIEENWQLYLYSYQLAQSFLLIVTTANYKTVKGVPQIANVVMLKIWVLSWM